MKTPKRLSMRRSRWAKRKARFIEIQTYKQQKRELGKLFLVQDKPDMTGYQTAVWKLKKSYGIQ